MDAGGTIPWMESVVSSLEQRPRAMQGAIAEICNEEAGRFRRKVRIHELIRESLTFENFH